MGDDLVVQLAYQAALHGVVDYTKANWQDKRWQQHLMLRLSGLLAQRKHDSLLAKLQFSLADMQARNGDTEDFIKVRDTTLSLLDAYCEQLQPWEPKKTRRSEQAVVDKLRSDWEKAFGRLDDPETQRGIRETCEALEAGRREKRADRARLAAARQKMLDSVLKKQEMRQRQHQLRTRRK